MRFMRNREAKRLFDFALQRKPALVCGQAGIGKTRLLRDVEAKLSENERRAIYTRVIQLLQAFLEDLARGFNIAPENTSSVKLRGLLWTAIEREPCIVLLDDIADASLALYRFFEPVINRPGLSLIGASLAPHTVGALHRVFWNQQSIVTLRPLNKTAAAAVLHDALLLYAPEYASDAALHERILKASRGVPGRIIDICRRLADPAYHDGDRIRFAALRIDSFTMLAT